MYESIFSNKPYPYIRITIQCDNINTMHKIQKKNHFTFTVDIRLLLTSNNLHCALPLEI